MTQTNMESPSTAAQPYYGDYTDLTPSVEAFGKAPAEEAPDADGTQAVATSGEASVAPEHLAYSQDPYGDYETAHLTPEEIAQISLDLNNSPTLTDALELFNQVKHASPLAAVEWIEQIGKKFGGVKETDEIVSELTSETVVSDAILIMHGEIGTATPDEAIDALVKAADLDPLDATTREQIIDTLDGVVKANEHGDDATLSGYFSASEDHALAVEHAVSALRSAHNTDDIKLEPLVEYYREKATSERESQELDARIAAMQDEIVELHARRTAIDHDLAEAESNIEQVLEPSRRLRVRQGLFSSVVKIVRERS